TSQDCSGCTLRKTNLTLADRTYSCTRCGLVIDWYGLRRQQRQGDQQRPPRRLWLSAATPDDPNVADGYYWLFSSLTGSHPCCKAYWGPWVRAGVWSASPPSAHDASTTTCTPPAAASSSCWSLRASVRW